MDYKPIRNKIRQFSYESFTTQVLKILRELDADSSRPQPFWHPLLLLKWGLEFAGETYPSREAARNDVAKIWSQLEKLEMAHDTFNLKTNGRLTKTFSILAQQQFVYQEPVWFDTFARQLVLFSRLKKRHDIAAAFLESTGLTIEEMLLGLKFLWLLVVRNCLPNCTYYGTFSQENWLDLEELLGKEKAQDFFRLLHVSRENIKSLLEADTRIIRDYNLQVFETSFFTRKPFLVFQNTFTIPHRSILTYTINHFIYDFMKHRDPKFSEELGERMEKYIALGLQDNRIPYQSENDLRKLLGEKSKVTDFLVEDEILIEAKAIELKPHISVNPTDALLSSELKQNLVKGYALQMLEVASRLRKHTEYFGIIITYKELHLGDTTDIWEQFLESGTLKVVPDRDRLTLLPKENLFFMDLANWDRVMQIVKTKKISLKQILLEAQVSAKDKKFGFYMHLDGYKIKSFDLSYLKVDGVLGV